MAAPVHNDDPIVSELRAASASLLLAVSAAEKGEWGAAEQGALEAQQRGAVALREIAMKLAEPPMPPPSPDE